MEKRQRGKKEMTRISYFDVLKTESLRDKYFEQCDEDYKNSENKEVKRK